MVGEEMVTLESWSMRVPRAIASWRASSWDWKGEKSGGTVADGRSVSRAVRAEMPLPRRAISARRSASLSDTVSTVAMRGVVASSGVVDVAVRGWTISDTGVTALTAAAGWLAGVSGMLNSGRTNATIPPRKACMYRNYLMSCPYDCYGVWRRKMPRLQCAGG